MVVKYYNSEIDADAVHRVCILESSSTCSFTKSPRLTKHTCTHTHTHTHTHADTDMYTYIHTTDSLIGILNN